MSNQQIPPTQAKAPLNKKQLFSDIVAFTSIVSSYFVISLTLHFNIFESQFGIVLNNFTTIVVLYLSYTALIITFKSISLVLSFIQKSQGENNLASWINNELNFSLLTILVITSVYILIHISSRAFTIQQFCHIALWLWISQVFRIFGGLLGRLTGISSLDYLGKSIGVILLLGALLQPFGAGIFIIF